MATKEDTKGGSPAEPVDVFVISPIGKAGTEVRERADEVLHGVIRQALDPQKYRVTRADESAEPGYITTDIINRIQSAGLVIADLTGHNPNVFYELAVAHGFQIPAVHIMEDGTSLPFDIAAQRAVSYDIARPRALFASIDALRVAVEKTLEGGSAQPTNPIQYAGRFLDVATSEDPEKELLATILMEVRKGRLGGGASSEEANILRRDLRNLMEIIAIGLREAGDDGISEVLVDYVPRDPQVQNEWEEYLHLMLATDPKRSQFLFERLMSSPSQARRSSADSRPDSTGVMTSDEFNGIMKGKYPSNSHREKTEGRRWPREQA